MLNEDTLLPPTTAPDVTPAPSRTAPRVGIAGAGFMARVHAHAARAAGAAVVGAAGSRPDRAVAAQTATRSLAAYADVEAMLDQADLDVLHVCTPNVLHAPLARAAAARGVHVVCEKPLAVDADEAASLVGAVDASGVRGFVPFVYRFHPMVREMAARVRGGEAGTIGLISGSYLQDWLADPTTTNWRVDAQAGGRSRAFADIGSHWFDLVEYVRGVRVQSVSARFATVFPARGAVGSVATEDSCTVHFEMTDGVIGTFAASQIARGRRNRLSLEISGDRQSYFFDQENAEALWIGDADGNRVLLRDPDRLHSEAARLSAVPAGHAQGYQDCFNAFVADAYAVIAGEYREGLPSFEDGLRSATVVDAVVASAASGGAWTTVADRRVAA